MLIPNLVAAALLVSPAPLSTGSEVQQGQESVTAEQLEELTRLVDAMSSEEEPTARLALADRVLALDWTTPKAQAFAHAIRGVALTELDREAEAIAAFDRSAALEPGNKVALVGLAGLAQLRGDHAEVERIYGIFIEEEPYEADHYAKRGEARVRGRRFPLAKEDFERARELDEYCAGAYIGLGMVALLEGDVVTAAGMHTAAEIWGRGADEQIAKFGEALGRLVDDRTIELSKKVAASGRAPDAWKELLEYHYGMRQWDLGVAAAQNWAQQNGANSSAREAAFEEAAFQFARGTRAKGASGLRRYLEATGWRDMEAVVWYSAALHAMDMPEAAERALARAAVHALSTEGWYRELAFYALGERDAAEMEEAVWVASGTAAQVRYAEMKFFSFDDSVDRAAPTDLLTEMLESPSLVRQARMMSTLRGTGESRITDDVNDILDAVPNGTKITLPAAEFTFLVPLKVTGRRRLTFTGAAKLVDGEWDGTPTRIRLAPKADGDPGVMIHDCNGVTFEGVEWVGEEADHALMDVRRTNGLALVGCKFVGQGPGLHVEGCNGLVVDSCAFAGTNQPFRVESLRGLGLRRCSFDVDKLDLSTFNVTGQLDSERNNTLGGILFLGR